MKKERNVKKQSYLKNLRRGKKRRLEAVFLQGEKKNKKRDREAAMNVLTFVCC